MSNTDENKERKTANKGERSELDNFRKKRHKQSLFKGNVCIYNNYTSQEAEKVMNIGGTNVAAGQGAAGCQADRMAGPTYSVPHRG